MPSKEKTDVYLLQQTKTRGDTVGVIDRGRSRRKMCQEKKGAAGKSAERKRGRDREVG